MIDYFKGFTQTYYSLIGTLMRHYFNDAFKLYDSGKVVQSKNIFYTAFDIQVKYELEPKKLDELNIDKFTKDEIKDVLDSSNYYIQQFIMSENVPNKNLSAYTDKELQEMVNNISKEYPNIKIRGIKS